MANFYITRKSFPDRLLTFDELDTFIDMIRRWYLLAVGKRGNTAHIHCETIIYAFPRQNAQTIRDTLAPLIPDALWDSPDPDELRATGIATNAVDTISSTVWQNILSQPIIQDTCIRLRITIRGQMPQQKIGTKTFVFCGAPSPFGLLLKAI